MKRPGRTPKRPRKTGIKKVRGGQGKAPTEKSLAASNLSHKPKGGDKIQPKNPQQVDPIYTEIKNVVFQIPYVYAVCTIPYQDGTTKYRITIDKSQSKQKETDVQNILNQIPGLNPQDVIFARSGELHFFAPTPVCAQHWDVKGSCGPFLSRSSTKELGVLSCAHVLPKKGSQLYIANLHSLQSTTAKVVFSDPSVDIGIALFDKPVQVSWKLFPSKIVPPVVNQFVSHFGSASVEESIGYIRSAMASAKLIDHSQQPPQEVVFNDVLCLAIDSKHGDSGSPVVTINNEVVGMIIGGDSGSGEIYCSNLSKFQESWPEDQVFDEILLNGTEERPWVNVKRERRREIELHMHCGKIIKNPTANSYGEIIADGNISILTHGDHSFDPDEKIDPDREVWFFAVPLEYIVREHEMVGANNMSPLLAVNVTNTRRFLEPLNGLHKRTPCGTGITV